MQKVLDHLIPKFDNLTARFIDELANGGRAGYAKGGLAKILEL